MKSYKITQTQIDTIKEGLARFINYVNEYCMEYKSYFSDMDKTNELYKKSPKTFFSDIGIDEKKFFDDYNYFQLLQIAQKTLDEIENIHTNVIGLFIDPSNKKYYPNDVKHWLYDFRFFCFDNTYNPNNFLSLEKQNERLAKYPHFDASTKRPKTFRTQNA